MLVFLSLSLELIGKPQKLVYIPPFFSPQETRAFRQTGPKRRDPGSPFFDQNFDLFLASIFGRFGAVLGPSWGVIFGPLGAQVGPSSLQDAFRKPIFVKNVDFAPVLRFPIRKLFF